MSHIDLSRLFQFYINEDLADNNNGNEERDVREDSFKISNNIKNPLNYQRKNDYLHKYHALDSNEETFIDVQEQNVIGMLHFNRHRRFLEIVEKEFFGKNFVLFNQDDVQFQSDQDLEDIIDEGCETENKIYSACSGYCSLVESEQIAYQNDEQNVNP